MSFLGLFSLRVYEEKPKDAADGVGSVHNSIVVSLFSLALWPHHRRARNISESTDRKLATAASRRQRCVALWKYDPPPVRICVNIDHIDASVKFQLKHSPSAKQIHRLHRHVRSE